MMSHKKEKIKGVSFVASRDSIALEHIKPIINLNANYASIMPFGFIKDLQHPEIVFNMDSQWFGETNAGTRQYNEALKSEGVKIMMKPQVWVWKGEFTGFIEMESEENWSLLEASYSKFILEFAQVAQETQVEIFCIGTELERFVIVRPEYWKGLINEIKEIYKGQLTYAANWNEFNSIPFWDDLDFIGVDAYFPLSASKTPSLAECKASWQQHKKLLKDTSEKHGRPIVFTEFGYRSVDYAAKEPWRSDQDMTEVNIEAQNNAMQSLFEEVWNEEWFAGGFVWKWFHEHKHAGGVNNSQFTPQNKPVESFIKAQYALQ